MYAKKRTMCALEDTIHIQICAPGFHCCKQACSATNQNCKVMRTTLRACAKTVCMTTMYSYCASQLLQQLKWLHVCNTCFAIYQIMCELAHRVCTWDIANLLLCRFHQIALVGKFMACRMPDATGAQTTMGLEGPRQVKHSQNKHNHILSNAFKIKHIRAHAHATT